MKLTHAVEMIALACLGATTILDAGEVYGSLQTPWAEQVSQESPLPEYPRPQMVREKTWLNLNGKWEYAITAAGAESPESWDGEILVPFAVESQLSGVGKTVGADKELWYRRTFERPEGDRVLLHFGAVDWRATVWVNGREAETHEGGFAPFSFDITGALNASGDQVLEVRVWDPTDAEPQPRGKQVNEPQGIFYTAVTGIWQTVWVEGVPTASISSVHPEPDLEAGAVRVTVNGRGATDEARVRITAFDDGTTIGTAEGQLGSAVEIAIPEAKLWTPDNPHLYDLEVELIAAGDVVTSYFAMREITHAKDEYGIQCLLLNGEPLFHYGLLDQGWWPDGLYTAPTDEALRWDVEKTREMGFNMARKHVKVEPARWYRHADELGLLVWQDMPSGFNDPSQNASSGSGKDASMPDPWRANFRDEWKEVIDAFRFFPSIVVWIPFNEGWGQHDTNEILQWTSEYDPTRLVGGPSGWEDLGWGHLKDKHSYPGPDMFPPLPDRTTVLGEFGGLGLVVQGHLWQEDKNWGYQNLTTPNALRERYTQLIDDLHPLLENGLAAAVYTQTTDVEGEVNGLITYDRRIVKLPPEVLTELHRPLYEPHQVMEIKVLLPTSETEAQEWSYTLEEPADGWQEAGFDTSPWETGTGGFGTAGTPGAVVGTAWNSSDIWIRRTFELPEVDSVQIRLAHDEDAEVFINGVEVITVEGWSNGYRNITVPDDKLTEALQAGENVVAIHCRQNDGGQFIDFGLVQRVPKTPLGDPPRKE